MSLPVVLLVSRDVPLLLFGGMWGGDVWDGVVGVGFWLLLVPLKKLLKLSMLSWLSSSRVNAKMAFLSVFCTGVGVSAPMREKAHLISCEWKVGLNSTQVNLP